jgi:hypothetical protein
VAVQNPQRDQVGRLLRGQHDEPADERLDLVEQLGGVHWRGVGVLSRFDEWRLRLGGLGVNQYVGDPVASMVRREIVQGRSGRRGGSLPELLESPRPDGQ